MSKYKAINFIFLLAFGTAVLFWLNGKEIAMHIVFLSVLYLLIVLYASLNIRLNFYIKSINQFNPSGKEVALTFDDGPSEKFTSEILSILNEFEAKATFFCIGSKVESAQKTIQSLITNGHSIGNHGFSHDKMLPLKSGKSQLNDIEKCRKVLTEKNIPNSNLYRPPFGVTNPIIARTIKKLGLWSIGWSVRSLDTLKIQPERIAKRVLRKTRPGSILLFHDDREQTPKVLKLVLRGLKNDNYTFVTIDEVLDRS